MRCSSLRPGQHWLTRTARITGQVPAFSGKQNKLSYTRGNVLGNSAFPHQLSLGFYLVEQRKKVPKPLPLLYHPRTRARTRTRRFGSGIRSIQLWLSAAPRASREPVWKQFFFNRQHESTHSACRRLDCGFLSSPSPPRVLRRSCASFLFV